MRKMMVKYMWIVWSPVAVYSINRHMEVSITDLSTGVLISP